MSGKIPVLDARELSPGKRGEAAAGELHKVERGREAWDLAIDTVERAVREPGFVQQLEAGGTELRRELWAAALGCVTEVKIGKAGSWDERKAEGEIELWNGGVIRVCRIKELN